MKLALLMLLLGLVAVSHVARAQDEGEEEVVEGGEEGEGGEEEVVDGGDEGEVDGGEEGGDEGGEETGGEEGGGDGGRKCKDNSEECMVGCPSSQVPEGEKAGMWNAKNCAKTCGYC